MTRTVVIVCEVEEEEILLLAGVIQFKQAKMTARAVSKLDPNATAAIAGLSTIQSNRLAEIAYGAPKASLGGTH